MSKARMMNASAGGTQYGVLTSINQGGGNKKQGLVSTTNRGVALNTSIRVRGGGHNRNWLFCMNQLGSVGRRWGQGSGPGNRGGVSSNCQRLAHRRMQLYPPRPRAIPPGCDPYGTLELKRGDQIENPMSILLRSIYSPTSGPGQVTEYPVLTQVCIGCSDAYGTDPQLLPTMQLISAFNGIFAAKSVSRSNCADPGQQSPCPDNDRCCVWPEPLPSTRSNWNCLGPVGPSCQASLGGPGLQIEPTVVQGLKYPAALSAFASEAALGFCAQPAALAGELGWVPFPKENGLVALPLVQATYTASTTSEEASRQKLGWVFVIGGDLLMGTPMSAFITQAHAPPQLPIWEGNIACLFVEQPSDGRDCESLSDPASIIASLVMTAGWPNTGSPVGSAPPSYALPRFQLYSTVTSA